MSLKPSDSARSVLRTLLETDREVAGEMIVIPSADELAAPSKTNLKCPTCDKVFKQPPALRMHLVKTHKIVNNDDDDSILHKRRSDKRQDTGRCLIKYHCPAETCKYRTGEDYFANLKNLKQHYMTMHAEKRYTCTQCPMAFGLERQLRQHRQEVCGVTFGCGECSKEFESRSAMRLHCRRYSHEQGKIIRDRYHAPAKATVISESPITQVNVFICTVAASDFSSIMSSKSVGSEQNRRSDERKKRLLWPKSSVAKAVTSDNATFSMPLPNSSEVDQIPVILVPSEVPDVGVASVSCGTQTSGDFVLRRPTRGARLPVNKVSTGSQVSPRARNKSPKSTTSTCVQTSTRKRKRGANASVSRPPASHQLVDDLLGLSDVETQTIALLEELQASLGASISTQTKDSFLSTSMITDDWRQVSDLTYMPNFSEPAPVAPAINFLESTETYPMASCADPMSYPSFATGFVHSDIQTQTIDTMFDEYLTNMETQTPFTPFEFTTDNETQTVAPQSVETQTWLHGRGQAAFNVQSNDIETQTIATDFDSRLVELAQIISGLP